MFLENLSRKFKFHENRTRMAGTLREDQCTYLIYLSQFLEWEIFQEKKFRGNQNTHLMSSKFSFFENRVVRNIMWKNIVERGRQQMTIWCMRVACWVPKATDKHSEYVILTVLHCNNVRTNAPQCYVIRALLSCVRSPESLNMRNLRMRPWNFNISGCFVPDFVPFGKASMT